MTSTTQTNAAALGGQVLVGARFAYGIACLVAPRVLVRALMLRPDTTPEHGQDYIVRLCGTRETFLAAVQAGLGGTSATKAAAFRLGMAVDAADVGALWLSRSRDRGNTLPLVAYTAAGLASIAAGHFAARDVSS